MLVSVVCPASKYCVMFIVAIMLTLPLNAGHIGVARLNTFVKLTALLYRPTMLSSTSGMLFMNASCECRAVSDFVFMVTPQRHGSRGVQVSLLSKQQHKAAVLPAMRLIPTHYSIMRIDKRPQKALYSYHIVFILKPILV